MDRSLVAVLITFVVCQANARSTGVLFNSSPALSGKKPVRKGNPVGPVFRDECAIICVSQEFMCSTFFYNAKDMSCFTMGTTLPNRDVLTSDSAFLAFLRQPPKVICPVGEGYAFSASLRLCLKANIAEKKTWTQAKAACEANGEQLAEAKTLKEEMFVRAYLKRIPYKGFVYSGALKVGNHYLWEDGTQVTQLYVNTRLLSGLRTGAALLFGYTGRVTSNVGVLRAYMCQKKGVTF